MSERCAEIEPSSNERCCRELGHEGNRRLDATAHRCHARGCMAKVPPVMLMCRKHWGKVPKHIQRAVWATYRRGQCDDMSPSKEWHVAADAAIGFVAKFEGQPLSKNERAALEHYEASK